MRRTAECNLFNHSRNEDILEKLIVDTVQNKLTQHKKKWLDHASKMEAIKHPFKKNPLTLDLSEHEDLDDH
jgi:hypothetical protein